MRRAAFILAILSACAFAGGSLNRADQHSGAGRSEDSARMPDAMATPSVAIARAAAGTGDGNVGYMVYTTSAPGSSSAYLRFAAFDSLGVYCPTVLDSAVAGESIHTPSIAVTPGDLVHVVWAKELPDRTQRVYYRTNRSATSPGAVRSGQSPIWLGKQAVSTSTDPGSEPVADCLAEAQGQYVSVSWRGPCMRGGDVSGEAWQRNGKIRAGLNPQWFAPRNVSQADDR